MVSHEPTSFGCDDVTVLGRSARPGRPLIAHGLLGGHLDAQAATAEKLSRDWKRIKTANFDVATNAPVEDVRRILDQLEVFRTNLVTRFLSLRTSAPLPTLVVVFRGDGAFDRFKPRDEKGKKREFVGAYLLSRT